MKPTARRVLSPSTVSCPQTLPLRSPAVGNRMALHVPGTSAVEANAREFVPAANAGWEEKFPGIVVVRDGWMRTDGVDGNGLCTSG